MHGTGATPWPLLSSRVRTNVSFTCFLRSGSVRGSVKKKIRTVLSKDVISSRPTLDMYHDDTVYLTSKLFRFHELSGWMFAVDT